MWCRRSCRRRRGRGGCHCSARHQEWTALSRDLYTVAYRARTGRSCPPAGTRLLPYSLPVHPALLRQRIVISPQPFMLPNFLLQSRQVCALREPFTTFAVKKLLTAKRKGTPQRLQRNLTRTPLSQMGEATQGLCRN